jgi:thiol-disulfide isomerase/thioredoxin
MGAAIQRITTSGLLLLTLGAAHAAAQANAAYDEQMHEGDRQVARHDYRSALDNYKHAFELTKKTSGEAALAMATAYRGLGDHKHVLDATDAALRLAGDNPRLQADAHNLRGSALFALSDKPTDKKMLDAEKEFRAAVDTNGALYNARYNLAMTLFKLGRDEEALRVMQDYVDRVPAGTDTSKAKAILADPRRAHADFAPEFAFTSREGESFSNEELKGKTVVLDFWGSWCGPCVASMPDMIKLHKKYAEQGVVFLGIAKDKEQDWSKFLEKHNLDWPQYLDASNRVLRQFAITGYPTYIVLDGEGMVRFRKMGYGRDTDGQIEKAIKDALKRSPDRIPHP